MADASSDNSADVVVIGGGPGGYVAAIRAAQLGLRTVCVEKDATLGGTCVNVGCIPSKAMLQSSEHYEFARESAAKHGIRIGDLSLDLATMQKRKAEVVGANTRGIEFLFKKHGVTWMRGTGKLRPGNSVDIEAAAGTRSTIAARDVIIATGSLPIALPFLPFDEKVVLSNVGALELTEVPQHLVVIGGGVIGLELGSVWRRLGAKVTVVELTPTLLPENDEDIIKEAERVFKRQGMELRLGTRVSSGSVNGNVVRLELEKDGKVETLEADRVLVSIGRRPLLQGIDVEELGLKVGKRGEIVTDSKMRTNLQNVYAIGDATGGKLLAHKAEEEGVVAAEVIAGMKSSMRYHAIPSVVYTWPEIATVGMTEQDAKDAELDYRVGKFPFSANGRARTMGESSGFVKLIADATTDELLGAHLIGPNVSELVAEIVLAFEYRAAAEDLGITVHAHPTLSEAVKEAALGALGRALHL